MMRRPSAVAKSTPKDPNMWLPIRARGLLELVCLRQPSHAGDARERHVGERHVDPGTLAGALPPKQGTRHRSRGEHAGHEIPRRQHVVDRYGRLRRAGHQRDADLCVDRVVDRRFAVTAPLAHGHGSRRFAELPAARSAGVLPRPCCR